ncbi:hypothetical protein JW964_08670 [candidate division KSB1 bacterium]|nr:hypothetical protein [candidate division KSB1 bacterium]
MEKLNNILQEIGPKISGFVSVYVVSAEGLTLASYSREKFNEEYLDAQMTIVMKLIEKSLNLLGQASFKFHLITTRKYFLSFSYVRDRSVWIGLVSKRDKGLIGNLQLIMDQYHDRIWNVINLRND